MTANPTGRLETLTSLRFFAAFFVLLFHVLPYWLKDDFDAWPVFLARPIQCGYISVSFFYMLSGFVLYYTYADQLPFNRISARAFFSRRFARLVPVFYLSLVLGAPLLYAAQRRADETAPFPAGVLPTLVVYLAANFAFLGAWWPASLGVNYPGWSISVEAAFYACFPWTAGYARKQGQASIWILLAAAFAVGTAFQFLGAKLYPELALWKAQEIRPPELTSAAAAAKDFLQVNPLVHLPEFFMGLLLGRLRELGVGGDQENGDTLLLAGLALLSVSLGLAGRISHLAMNSCFLMPAMALMVWGGSKARSGASRWLEAPFLVLLGEASYALYILHVPLRDWFSFAQRRFLPDLSSALQVGIFLPLAVAISVGVYFLWERPWKAAITNHFDY